MLLLRVPSSTAACLVLSRFALAASARRHAELTGGPVSGPVQWGPAGSGPRPRDQKPLTTLIYTIPKASSLYLLNKKKFFRKISEYYEKNSPGQKMTPRPLQDFSEEIHYIYICTRETLRLIYESFQYQQNISSRITCEDHSTERAGS
jgi:hypothetical protein